MHLLVLRRISQQPRIESCRMTIFSFLRSHARLCFTVFWHATVAFCSKNINDYIEKFGKNYFTLSPLDGIE